MDVKDSIGLSLIQTSGHEFKAESGKRGGGAARLHLPLISHHPSIKFFYVCDTDTVYAGTRTLRSRGETE